MGHKYKTPSRDIEVRHCLMENGHGAVTIGSEMAGGVYNVHVTGCTFVRTDRGLRVKTRRGRGKDAVVDGIVFENITMHDVRTPFVVNAFYNCCDPDAHSEYVRSKHPLPVDDRTPAIKSLRFQNIRCENCHVAAAFLYGLPEQKIEDVVFDNISVSFSDTPIPMEPAMMDDIDEETTRMGLFIANARQVTLRNVSIHGNEGDTFLLSGVDACRKEDGTT